jgi:hypothetical protein
LWSLRQINYPLQVEVGWTEMAGEFCTCHFRFQNLL